jgi:phytoene dehydrogenase-like protein
MERDYKRGLLGELSVDAVIIGAGHNGLVCGTFLARSGLRVLIVEEKDKIGGATKTEALFDKAPALAGSKASYLVGPMPPELLAKLGVRLPIIKRNPFYFMPLGAARGEYLLFGDDKSALRQQFERHLSLQDWEANEAFNAEIEAIRDDLGPSWMMQPLSVEETARTFIRPELRQVNDFEENDCRDSLTHSSLVFAMVRLTSIWLLDRARSTLKNSTSNRS